MLFIKNLYYKKFNRVYLSYVKSFVFTLLTLKLALKSFEVLRQVQGHIIGLYLFNKSENKLVLRQMLLY